jgi:hypothetical protein
MIKAYNSNSVPRFLSFRLWFVFSVILCCTGCIPYLGTTRPGVSGFVLNRVSEKPIGEAPVIMNRRCLDQKSPKPNLRPMPVLNSLHNDNGVFCFWPLGMLFHVPSPSRLSTPIIGDFNLTF